MDKARSLEEGTRLRALVRGKVQKVYFRDFARRHAQLLGLTGWVRNLPDGATLEVVAEGPRPAIEQLLAYLRQGPLLAQVTRVDAEWGASTGEFDSFEVRR